MALQKREKGMLAVVVTLLVVAGGVFLVQGGGSSGDLAREKEALTKEIERQKTKAAPGKKAAAKLAAWRKQSLPEDIDVARDLYNDWLAALVIDEIGFENVEITPQLRLAGGAYYTALPFRVEAEGTLDQLTKFLYAFYSTNYLHKIESLSVQPSENTTQLRLAVRLQAICLPKAVAKDTLPEGDSDRLKHDELDEYREMIARRRMEPNAEGADEPYRFGEERSGLFASYKPAPPPRRVITRQERPVVETPPERPVARPTPFDHSNYTFVNSIQEINGEREVWFYVRTEGRTLRLREGDPFEVGQMSGKVARIRLDERDVDIETDRGLQRIDFGNSIRAGVRVRQ